MKGERGATILVAFHVGATARWLAEHGSAIDGSKKGKETGERRKGKKKGMGPADGRLTGRASGAVKERRDGGRIWAKAEVERPTNWAAGAEVKPRRAGASECRRRRAGQQR